MNGHDWKNETAVGAPFIEDMDTQLTIAEYASRQGISVYSVRRRIKTGVLLARVAHGRHFIVEQGQVRVRAS